MSVAAVVRQWSVHHYGILACQKSTVVALLQDLTPRMIVAEANQKETSLHEMPLVIADSGYVVTAYLTEEVRHKMKTN